MTGGPQLLSVQRRYWELTEVLHRPGGIRRRPATTRWRNRTTRFRARRLFYGGFIANSLRYQGLACTQIKCGPIFFPRSIWVDAGPIALRSRPFSSSLGSQDKTGLVTAALPIESFRALFPIPDLLWSKKPKDFGIGHRNITPISFASHELT